MRAEAFYTASDKELIQQIAWLVKDQGYTIDGARKALEAKRSGGSHGCGRRAGRGTAGEQEQLLERVQRQGQIEALSEQLGDS